MEKETAITILQKESVSLEQLMLTNMPANMSIEHVKALVAEEISYIQQVAMYKPDLVSCEPISVLLAVKQIIRKNLTLDPSANLTYIKTRSVKNSEGKWVKVLEIQETANGKLSVARQCGRILDQKRPKVVFDDAGKVKEVTVEFLVPSHPQPRWEVITFDNVHFNKWRKASHQENSRGWAESSGRTKPDLTTMNYANPNYTAHNGGIDPEFAGTKAIRHGLSKLGTNINELNAVRIVVPAKDVQVVQETANAKEFEQEQGFTDYVEIKQPEGQTTPNGNEESTPAMPPANSL